MPILLANLFKVRFSIKPLHALAIVFFFSLWILLVHRLMPDAFRPVDNFPLFLFVAVLVQPLIEEYLFRHLVQKIILLRLAPLKMNFKPTQKWVIFSIILTAFVFTVLHPKNSIQLYLLVFANSLVYGTIYQKLDSITGSWLAHATGNLLSVIL